MKTQMLLSLACSLSLLGAVTVPASAQPTTNAAPQPTVQPQAASQDLTIPQDTAIIVSFPASVTVDVGQKKDYPLTLPLASAIKDAQGNVVAPENTPVTIVLKPTDGGAKIVAQSLVINGRIVSIKASSQMIPGTTITQKRANDKAVENGSVWGRLTGSTLGFISNGDPEQFDRGAMLGSAIGLVTGLRSAENTRIVQIPQSSVYVLSLEAPIQLSGR
ncbi:MULTISPECIES: hypothetical protein [unclassified Tolypothrix]|uniref:hypothetical protein n=1 Tax=unclassified Tolypothrix TaxID=2649714 RepID=UPI0005EAA391|nr:MULTISPECIES: hypothetical protein [unclassified Tolypothrix]BAY93312.1 hypothetical protein NIES3275_53510 [Microchaete diplosiphon NIES-3275]EKF00077.1 hypothetical protein FDUTEX481_09284 [Tolypothrix sp. PCC 7601]MBE9085539.1 hypothetical protein [Tolypothrix sp. LEGE 11397]UYD27171.1 hypothetical protein HGR01_03450 [Tolypothrix sp. PCC 7712]UYD36969.1 hypothetical protein HG267_15300 [Tolypothrix sp. PCC 7601]